jgi:ABC-2 type transport system permease protein/oleandomycin transport system permease protein
MMSFSATEERKQPQIEVGGLRSLSWAVRDTLVMTKRNLIRYVRVPQLLVFSTVQPIIFVLLFAYVFGGAIETPGVDYINFLIPGILVQTVLFGATQATVGLAEDLSGGMVDRFRSLPMARLAVLAGRTLADSVRNFFVVLIMIGVGYLIGFRFQDGLLSAALAVALVVLFGYAFTWISVLVGLFAKDPESAQVAGFIWVFPLVFASSAFVPVESMPGWLEAFAEVQPVSVVVDAARVLTLGGSTDVVWWALAWIAGITAVFAPLAVARYRRST